MFELHLHSMVRQIKLKYNIETVKHKDVFGIIFTHIKIVTACFIPLFNISVLFLLLFKSELIDEIYKNRMEEILKGREISFEK